MAFWFILKDSVTRIEVLRFLLVALFIQFINCAPIKKLNNDDWWCQPCKELHLRTRHSRQIRNALKDQFDSTIFHYEVETKKYTDYILPKIGNVTKTQIKKMKWLPRKHFFSKIQKGDTKILPELHKYVQVYAATLQRLIDMEFRTHDPWLEASQRLKNFTLVKQYLNLLRCELEDEIFQHRLEGELVQLKKSDWRRKIKVPFRVNNIAEGLVMDHAILEDYHKFLKKCRSKLFGGARNRKNKNRDKVRKGKKKNRNKGALRKTLQKS